MTVGRGKGVEESANIELRILWAEKWRYRFPLPDSAQDVLIIEKGKETET